MSQRQSFEGAIAALLNKLAIPTEQWDTLWGEINDYAFGIAGVVDVQVLEDIQIALLEALENGTGLAEFREQFDATVARRGWAQGAGFEPHRIRLIFEQNLRTAYAAGRWQQMTDPDILSRRPYWMWRHRDSLSPRLHHLAMDGVVFRAEDAIAQGINFPLGFGCKCTWLTLSESDLAERGLTVQPFPADRVQMRDRITGQTQDVPAIPVQQADGTTKLAPIADPGFLWPTGATPASERERVLRGAADRLQDPDLRAIAQGRIS